MQWCVLHQLSRCVLVSFRASDNELALKLVFGFELFEVAFTSLHYGKAKGSFPVPKYKFVSNKFDCSV
jgi:hypothetical protein